MKFLRSLALGLTLGLGAASAALAASAIPSGTTLYGNLSTDLNTANASVGDGFSVAVTSPYPNGDTSYSGAYIRGHVASVVKAGQGRKASLGLAFDRIVLSNGTSSSLSGHVIKLEQKKQSAIPQQAIGAGVGMLLGNAVGKMVFGSGMHMGGLAGAAGGFIYANNLKTNFTVPKGSQIQVQTDREVARPQAHH